MLKKLFIIPYYGEWPEWMSKYTEQMSRLKKYGYDFYITNDIDDFCRRAREVLDIDIELDPGTSKLHDFRTAFGLMYQDILEGYDFWGITDLDCVYGNILNFMPDEDLKDLDIWSNHHNYICGPWTLFKNIEKVNNLFKKFHGWHGLMAEKNNQNPGRWTEQEYSDIVDREHELGNINRKYTFYQGKDPNIDNNLKLVEDKLFDGDDQIMMFHFNRKKRWPI